MQLTLLESDRSFLRSAECAALSILAHLALVWAILAAPGNRFVLPTTEREVRHMLLLPPDRVPTRRDWSRLSSKWSTRIDDRIGELERLKAGLTDCIGCGCLSLDRCQLANPGDRVAARGAGPRYWIGDRRPT